MSQSSRTILKGTGFFLFVFVVAVIGYMVGGWSPLEAVYMVIITIFGVGYGEVRPMESPGMRVFTIFVIIAGCSALIYILGAFLQMLTEGEINRALGARRMTRGIEKLENHVIICGFGRIGAVIVERLKGTGQPFVIIDRNEERLHEAEDKYGALILIGDATEENTLIEAGVERARVLATVLPNDAANVFITLSARNLNADLEIIARGEAPSTEVKLVQAGANRVVLPAAIGGMRMAQIITRPGASRYIEELSDGVDLGEELTKIGVELYELEVPAHSHLVGKTLQDARIEGSESHIVIAIRSKDGAVLKTPPSDARLKEGDTVIVMAAPDKTLGFARQADGSKMVFRGISS